MSRTLWKDLNVNWKALNVNWKALNVNWKALNVNWKACEKRVFELQTKVAAAWTIDDLALVVLL